MSPSTFSASDKYLHLAWDNEWPGIREIPPDGYKWSKGGLLVPGGLDETPVEAAPVVGFYIYETQGIGIYPQEFVDEIQRR